MSKVQGISFKIEQKEGDGLKYHSYSVTDSNCGTSTPFIDLLDGNEGEMITISERDWPVLKEKIDWLFKELSKEGEKNG